MYPSQLMSGVGVLYEPQLSVVQRRDLWDYPRRFVERLGHLCGRYGFNAGHLLAFSNTLAVPRHII